MERIRDANTILLQQRELPFQEKKILEALQIIKTNNKNKDNAIFARQAIIMLEANLLDYIKKRYGEDDKHPYVQLSVLGFGKRTGVREQYLAEYVKCYDTTPPNDCDLSYIHKGLRRIVWKSSCLQHRDFQLKSS